MPGPDPATLTFSTRHLPPPSRHRALHELSERGLLPVVPLADGTPRVDLVKWRLPGASVLSRDRGVRAARLTAIKADISRHLTDGSLSVATLAARHGITPRYVHKLFEDDEMTCSQYVLDQRLALAYRRLRDPRLAGRTVSSIAHDAGFGDLSYFNRTFRHRYGVTPSVAREPTPG
jgi:AraC-like DNA-binding protein